MKKILCPVDFSENSLNAIEFAVRIGEAHQAELTLLHVFTEKEFGEALSKGLLAKRYRRTEIDNLVQYAEELLQSLTHEVNHMSKGRGLVHCYYHFSYGSLEKYITRYAQEQAYSLIVMGTGGIKDVFEEYAGSHAIKTVERTPCPVLCIPEKVTYAPFAEVVYATNYQEEDDQALQQLVEVIKPFNGAIKALHVYAAESNIEEAMYRDFATQAKAHISYENITFSHLKFRDPAHGIDRYAIDQKANLVALYGKKRSLFEKIFLEGTTKNVAYMATYPVLVLKTP